MGFHNGYVCVKFYSMCSTYLNEPGCLVPELNYKTLQAVTLTPPVLLCVTSESLTPSDLEVSLNMEYGKST